MKRIFIIAFVGLIFIAPNVSAQKRSRSERIAARQERMEAWHRDMAEFRARSNQDNRVAAIADSIAHTKALLAIMNQDFVLETQSVTFRNGKTIFVNSTKNFISLRGSRAVVQISPSNIASGPNGIGGITVDGMASALKVSKDRNGRTVCSMNVTGVGINAQVEIYLYPEGNRASASINPNFNSNTLWVEGNIVPYADSQVFEGMSF